MTMRPQSAVRRPPHSQVGGLNGSTSLTIFDGWNGIGHATFGGAVRSGVHPEEIHPEGI
jgi:hypothetical protein